MFSSLIQHVGRYVPLSPAGAEALASSLRPLTVKKKAYLLKEGQVCTTSYFVVKGCLRCYFINEKGVEQIIHFAIENWWMTDYTSLDSHEPSQFFIQAVERCELIALDRQVQEAVFARLPQMERYFRIILQRSYAAAQMRIKYIFSLTGEERYHRFAQAFPGFIQRIPQYMLASYLGFTPEFLSKIRAKHLQGSIS